MILIAIIVITFFHKKFSHMRKNVIVCIAFVFFFTVSVLFPKLLLSSMNITLNLNQSFGAAHFLMMGINPRNHGYYDSDDVYFSMSFPTQKARNQADMQVFFERLQDYGVTGYLNVLHDKIANTYNDGTFAWAAEGNFWMAMYPEQNNFISPFLRSFYYENGSRYAVWCTWAQFLWLATLLFALFSVLDKQQSKSLAVLQVTLCGLFAFEMLFEVRARYIYTCIPLYIVLAVIGLHNLYRFIVFHLKRPSKNTSTEV